MIGPSRDILKPGHNLVNNQGLCDEIMSKKYIYKNYSTSRFQTVDQPTKKSKSVSKSVWFKINEILFCIFNVFNAKIALLTSFFLYLCF